MAAFDPVDVVMLALLLGRAWLDRAYDQTWDGPIKTQTTIVLSELHHTSLR